MHALQKLSARQQQPPAKEKGTLPRAKERGKEKVKAKERIRTWLATLQMVVKFVLRSIQNQAALVDAAEPMFADAGAATKSIAFCCAPWRLDRKLQQGDQSVRDN